MPYLFSLGRFTAGGSERDVDCGGKDWEERRKR